MANSSEAERRKARRLAAIKARVDYTAELVRYGKGSVSPVVNASDSVYTFGKNAKYPNTPITDVPIGYLKFLSRLPKLNWKLKKAIDQELRARGMQASRPMSAPIEQPRIYQQKLTELPDEAFEPFSSDWR
jgi:hypothetical protein